jgi:phospholipid/cholesterol/gamma-HCH transport system substrate-binding protein
VRSFRAQLVARVVALVALGLAAMLLTIVLVGGGGDYEVTAELENASQLVRGNLVTVGGVGAGSVERIELGDHGQALVTFTVDERYAPLPRDTTVTVRSVSLASIAGRRLELTLPPNDDAATIPDGGTIGEDHTTSEVDLDEVFNTLDQPTVRDLKRVIAGLERSGSGVAEQANRGFHYLNPLFATSRRVLGELGTDKHVLTDLIVQSSRLSSALAARAPEISDLVRNLDVALGAIGRQRTALSAAVSKLPPFLRRADTTLVNLRAAAGDLDPLVIAARPVANRLGPVFHQFRGVAHDAVPTIRDLSALTRRRGADNDLVEVTRLASPLARRAVGDGSPDCGVDPSSDYATAADGNFKQGALGEARCALQNSEPILSTFRAYTPELVGWFDDFSTTGTLDANGGIGRIAGTFNSFSASSDGLPELLSPVDPADLYGTGGSGALLDVNNNSRCPGANERDPGDGSVPFTDNGQLNCDPSEIPVGP